MAGFDYEKNGWASWTGKTPVASGTYRQDGSYFNPSTNGGFVPSVPTAPIPNPWFDYPVSPAPCPGCGRCPYCGRRNVDPYFYPATPSYPPYKITYVCSVNGIS